MFFKVSKSNNSFISEKITELNQPKNRDGLRSYSENDTYNYLKFQVFNRQATLKTYNFRDFNCYLFESEIIRLRFPANSYKNLVFSFFRFFIEKEALLMSFKFILKICPNAEATSFKSVFPLLNAL